MRLAEALKKVELYASPMEQMLYAMLYTGTDLFGMRNYIIMPDAEHYYGVDIPYPCSHGVIDCLFDHMVRFRINCLDSRFRNSLRYRVMSLDSLRTINNLFSKPSELRRAWNDT